MGFYIKHKFKGHTVAWFKTKEEAEKDISRNYPYTKHNLIIEEDYEEKLNSLRQAMKAQIG